MTLVIVLNTLLVTLVLGTIVGLHVWAILTSRAKEKVVAQLGGQRTARAERRRAPARRRLGSAVALR